MAPLIFGQSLALVGLILPFLTSAVPRAVPEPAIDTSNPPKLTFDAIFQSVVNPGFEDSSNIAQISPWYTEGTVELNTDKSYVRDGSNSLLFESRKNPYSFTLQQTVSVIPGYQYKLNFASRLIPTVGATGCKLDTCINKDCTGGGPPGTHDFGVGGEAVTLSENWQEVSRTWTAPGNKVTIMSNPPDLEKQLGPKMEKIVIAINSGGAVCNGRILIDNVTLQLVGALEFAKGA